MARTVRGELALAGVALLTLVLATAAPVSAAFLARELLVAVVVAAAAALAASRALAARRPVPVRVRPRRR